jgi:hypothetical protein
MKSSTLRSICLRIARKVPIELSMGGNYRLRKRLVSAHDDVAPMLTANPETDPQKGGNDLLPRHPR